MSRLITIVASMGGVAFLFLGFTWEKDCYLKNIYQGRIAWSCSLVDWVLLFAYPFLYFGR
jgi:hypothetical protein